MLQRLSATLAPAHNDTEEALLLRDKEALVQQAISRLIAGKTVIVIAHRLRTVAGADKIIVLNEGRLVEQGTHEELMRSAPEYVQIYDSQRSTHHYESVRAQ